MQGRGGEELLDVRHHLRVGRAERQAFEMPDSILMRGGCAGLFGDDQGHVVVQLA
jgi:hypothetical protein